MNVSIKLPSRIWKMLEIVEKKSTKIFSCFVLFSRIFENRIIYERILSGVYVYKISCRYLDKWPSFVVLKVKKGHFSRCFLRFLHFPYFQNFPIWAVQKCSRVTFLVVDD